MAKRRRPNGSENLPAAPQDAGDRTDVAAPDRERIASRAYELWIQRGGAHGRDVEDWLDAERELVYRRPQPGRNEEDER
jgi:DUF2934 family protein